MNNAIWAWRVGCLCTILGMLCLVGCQQATYVAATEPEGGATSAISVSSDEVDQTAIEVLKQFAGTDDIKETRASVFLYGNPMNHWVALDDETSKELVRALLTSSRSAGHRKGEMAQCRPSIGIFLRGLHRTLLLDVDDISFVTGEEQHRFCNAEASKLLRRVFKKASDEQYKRLDHILEAASKPYVPSSE